MDSSSQQETSTTLILLPKIHQHVDFPIRGDNLLDLYTIYKGAYKAFSLPHLGLSDHITIMLRPAYRLEARGGLPSADGLH